MTMRYLLILCMLCIVFCTSLSAQQLPKVQFEFGDRQFESNIDETTKAGDILQGESFNNTYFRFVQFENIPSDENRTALTNKGIDFMEYIPQNCYLLAIPDDVDLNQLYSAGARAIQTMDVATKTDMRIMDDLIPEYAYDGEDITLKVKVMPGVNLDAQEDNFTQLGAYNIERPNHRQFIFLTASRQDALAIANLAFVRYVELMDEAGVPESVEGRTLQRSNLINNQLTGGLSYDGDGIGILVRDDGDVGPHIDFQGRLWNDPSNGSSGTHGDGVAGVWAACGNLDPTVVAGAPAADLYIIDYLSTFLDNTLDLHLDSGVLITNSSYSNGCNAGYTTTTETVDEMAHDNPTLLHVFSAGNSNNNDCGYGAGNQWGNVTGGHKQGKNVIAVANLFRDGELVNSSSRGPAHDGRIKPDLAGHGAGQMSTDPNNAYSPFGGTSAAAPSTAGNLTQLYDAYQDLNGGTTPPAALIKACALNSAQDYGNVGPDFKFGWGLIHTGRAYDIIANNQYSSHSISNNGSNTHTVNVPAGVGQLRIMIYWNDPEASPSANPALVNDLDMTVDDPSSTNYLPYLLDHTPDPVTLDLPAGNGVDHLNNVEQVAITTPAAGNYTVNVDGFSVPQGPQEYFLVYSFIPTGVQVTYPLGNEKIVPNVVERIHWDAFGDTGTFDVEYSTDNGGSWNTVALGVAAEERGVDWTPPAVTSGDCLVRVTRGAESDVSDATFNIHDVPTDLCAVDGNTGEAIISWSAVPGATSYNVYQLGAEKMTVIATTAATSHTVSGVSAGTTYWFSVSANSPGVVGQRAFASSYEVGASMSCIGCTATVGLPYAEGFESGLGDHCNPSCDYFDWETNTGDTPSSGTGPSAAFEGSTYIYTEASAPNFPNRIANLLSPCISLAGCTNSYMSFRYHMLGEDMGTLEINISTDMGSSWSAPVYSISDDQGDVWHQAFVDLSAYCGQTIMYRLRGITGDGFESDIAIDDIKIEDGAICFPPTNFQVNSIFVDAADAEWADVSANSYEVELVNTSTGGSATGTPTTTGIVDTFFSFTGLSSLSNYQIYVRSRCGADVSEWVGPRSFTTLGTCIGSLPWTENFDAYSTCSTQSGPQSCPVGGGWVQATDDDNDWRVNSGTTPTTLSGPISDNTSGAGNYMYIEASGTFNLVSNLISPCIDLTGVSDAEIEFYYHMYGDDMGTLNVDISDNGGATWTNLWSQIGQVQLNEDDEWVPISLNLGGFTGPVNIRFQGIAGSSFNSDMAIDDIRIVESCQPVLNLTNNIASGLYKALEVNAMNANVSSPNNVTLSGKNGVDLQPEFEVQQGAIFEANNDDCP